MVSSNVKGLHIVEERFLAQKVAHAPDALPPAEACCPWLRSHNKQQASVRRGNGHKQPLSGAATCKLNWNALQQECRRSY